MRTTKVSIKKVHIKGAVFWQVTVPKIGGGRNRRTFKSRNEAQTFCDLSKVQQTNFGAAALSISESLRVEATECEEKLRPFGKTLRDATEYYIAYLQTVAASHRVRDVVDELIAARKADGLSDRYLGDLRVRLARFNADFGDELIAAISPKQIADWLRRMNVGPVTRNTFRRRLSALFTFARRCGYLKASPVVDVERAKERAGEVPILTVEQTEKLLTSASPQTLPYWAIGAFAGLRTAELERLNWADIDWEAGLIEVKAQNAKTASRRHVKIQANLHEWLAPYVAAEGAVCPVGLRKRLDADRDRAGLRAEWPQNGPRHSFASYHLAKFGNPTELAMEMGNSPAIIFRHYRELVKPAVATRYWDIRPKAP